MNDIVGQKARREARANGPLDSVDEFLGELAVFAKRDEQQQTAWMSQVLEVQYEGVKYLGQRLDGRVDFARAHAQAEAIDGGVTAAIDDATAVRGDLYPIAVAPYPLVHVEVARQIALIVLVAPKIKRHAGYRACAYQFAHFIYDRLSGVIPSLNRRPQLSALHFARNLRQLAIAGAKTTEEVRAARNVVPPDVCSSDGVELQGAPPLHVFRQRGTGAAKSTNAGKIAAVQSAAPLFCSSQKKPPRRQRT